MGPADEQKNIRYPHDHGGDAVGDDQRGQRPIRLDQRQNAETDEPDPQEQIQPAKTRAPSHCAAPPFSSSINSSPVMVSFS